jgi:hypothetical protein
MSTIKKTRPALKKVVAFHRNENGQLLSLWLTAIMAMGSVFMGTAYDMSNAWVHKQWADTAAEASCTAGAMDMLYAANAGTSTAPNPAMNFLTAGPSSGDCASNSSNAMCYYANLNGYSSKGVTANTVSNDVSWNLTTQPSNPQQVSSSAAISGGKTTNHVPAYLNVTVTENVPVTFMGIFAKAFNMSNSWSTVQVVGHCNCGIASSGSGGAAGGQEQTLTAQCPIYDAVFSHDWEIVALPPTQIRLTGDTGDNWDPPDWLNFQCGGNWTDSQGVSQPRNYLATIPGATIDGVEAFIPDTCDYDWTYYPVFEEVALIANNGTGFTVGTRGSLPPNAIPGEPLISTDNFILYNKPYATWPYVTFGAANSTQQWAPGNSVTGMWGISQANMMNAVTAETYFGFAVAVQGAGERVFIGNGTSNAPYITVYYHTGGYVVATFGND